MQAEDLVGRVKARIHTRSGEEEREWGRGARRLRGARITAVGSTDVVSLRQPEGREPCPSGSEIAKFTGVGVPRARSELRRRVCTPGGSERHCAHRVLRVEGDLDEPDKLIPLCRGGHTVARRSSGSALMLTCADRREDKGVAI